MKIKKIDLDVDSRSLVLEAEDGRTATYRRDDSPFRVKEVHLQWGPHGGMALDTLVNREDFPEEVVVMHESPAPQGPVGVAGSWSSTYRYVREKG